MHSTSFLKRLRHDYLAFIYAFCYRTTRPSLVGLSIGRWLRLSTLVLILIAWFQRWEPHFFALVLLLAAWVHVVYWQAQRAGYVRFVPEPMDATSQHKPLPPYQRIKLWATGVFSVNGWEDYVVVRPAEYWQVPLGDHVVMAQAGRDRFLYQFINPNNVQKVEFGCLLFGAKLQHTIAINFLETHHAIQPLHFNFATPEDIEAPSQERTIYFTFKDEAPLRAVWHNLLNEAHRQRP